MTATDGTFETGTLVGWGGASGGTFVPTTAQAHTGVWSGLLTTTGTPTQTYVRSNSVAVTAGTKYRLLMWARSATTVTNVTAAVDWANAGGYLSTSSLNVTLTANTWTLFDATFTAPAGATSAGYGPTLLSNPAAGSAVYVDDIYFVQTSGAYPLPTFRDGVLATAADLNALAAYVNSLYTTTMGHPTHTAKKPAVVLRVTGTHAVATGTDTAAIWDVADVNNDSMWVVGTPTQVTIQTAGTYKIDLTLGTSGVYGDGLTCYITVNGTTASTNGVGVWHDTKSDRGRATCTVSLAAGATVFGIINHTAGVSRNLATTVGGCRFELTYLGPA